MKKTVIGYYVGGAGMNEKGVLEKMISEEWHKFSNIYEINYLDSKFKITGRFKNYDIINTYDGYCIVSQKFKDFCFENHYENLEFVPFPNDSLFYWFKVHNIVEFDAQKKGTRFINYSSKYNGFEEIIGANPVILKDNVILKDTFYRTDLFFADGESKHPLILIGIETKIKISKAKMKGVSFEEILKV